jgi:hypothetical protein
VDLRRKPDKEISVKSNWWDAGTMLRFGCALAICVSAIAPAKAQNHCAGCTCATDYAMPGAATIAPADQYPSGQQPSPQSVPSLAEEQFASLGGDTISLAQSNVGYIDSALISTHLRMRFDAAYDMNRGDRAEYYYTTAQAFGGQLVDGMPDPSVDFQYISTYLEYALTDRFSVYADVPVLFNNPSILANHAGLGDMQAGFKWGLSSCCDRQLTFRLNNYIPTGDPEAWLGTGHYSIEPGILYFQRLSDRLTLEAQFKDWISVGGSVNPANDEPFAGNVLQYGVGLGYDWCQHGCWKVTPVVEFVGWTVLEGQVTDFDDQGTLLGPVDASGDTIVNVKLGARITDCCGGSVYAGYGRSLTGDRWYEELFRLEFRRPF